MGIRFLCPNGHRLNVKAFLAGKRGVCPDCGAKMMIPLESQLAPRSKKEREEARKAEAAATSANGDGGGTATATKPAVAAKPDIKDPIDESPDMVWYVRPKAGGQYGPARGEVMKRWIGEGRVAADSLVWREGWDDWEPAREVLPQLATVERETDEAPPSQASQPKAAPPTPAAPKAAKTASPAVPKAATPKPAAAVPKPATATAKPVAAKEATDNEPVPAATSTVKRRRRRKTNPKALTAVVVLSLVSIGLLIALVVVLMKGGSA